MPKTAFSIGELATQAGCKVPTIRYYESIGLLGEAPRTDGGHRAYGHDEVKRLTFIRRSRELGFSLDSIRSLLDLAGNSERPCAEVDLLVMEHLGEIAEKLRLLSAMRAALQDMLDQCRHTTIHECRVIEALSPGPDATSPPSESRARTGLLHA